MQSGRMNKMPKSKGKKSTLNSKEEIEAEKEATELIKKMIEKMTEASQNDRESYKAKRPALQKLLMSSSVYERLKNLYL